MWYLKSQKNASTIYYLRPDIPKHIVSRSTGNLIITNDPSISRNHAFLFPESDDSLKLVDAGSRYGTFVNYASIDGQGEGEEIPKDVPVRLSPGDRVRFGKCDSLWLVERVEFRCISSTISVTDGLVKVLRKLGGVLEDGFVEGKTRYLVMRTITTTPKLLMSLIGQIPVVTPEYFEECLKAVEKGQELPDVEGFVPEFTEAYVRREGISFGKVPGREKLFEGMTFVFIKPKHMTQYEGIVKMAGGKCVCAQKRKIAKSYFTQDKVIVIQVMMDSLSQGTSQAIDGLTQIVSNAGRRLIPEAEIGLAILHCSLEKYCNPLYKFTNVLDLDTVPFEAHGDTLARNTEEVPSGSKKSKAVESISIPETESHDNLPGTLQSTNFSDAELKISEVESEFAKANENETTGRSKRKRTEPVEPPKEVKRLRSKPVEVEPQLEIPETPEESSPPPPSQPQAFSGFLSVNHEEALPESTTTKSAQKPKRPLQLMLDDGEDDLFNFAEAAPKRPKRQPTLTESFSTSSQRSQRNALEQPPAGDDLFAFGNESSRRTKRNVKPTSTTPASKSDESARNGNANATSYKQFIKPIQIPVDSGWLSSTFCELKIKAHEDGEVTVKIKEEPTGEEDDKTRVWIDGMQSMFQVRVKCMNLTSHHQRRDESSSERSFFATGQGSGAGGGKNFKAFVKKHNYKPQQTIVKTMPVCVLDNTQDDHF